MIKPMLAKNYKNQDVQGWYMSEKLDGVRCIWDGEHFYSRNGNRFYAPDWFYNGMPDNVVLDGELYQGLGRFQETCGIVRRHDDDWHDVKFMVFDLITIGIKFADRLTMLYLNDNNGIFPNHVQILDHYKINDQNTFDDFRFDIIQKNGEGVILKNPESLYQNKRSNDLLKVKTFHSDECTLVEYQDGKGKHLGCVGAFICEWQGKIIKLGTGLSDDDRINPPDIGSILTFSFFELTNSGLPRFPTYIGVRDYE